jgi:hypothetical protein
MFQGKGGTVWPDLTNAGGRPAREFFRRIVMRRAAPERPNAD